MGVYVFLAIIYAVCAYLKPSSNMGNRAQKIYLFVLLLPLFVLTAFRSTEVGNDTYNYFRSYNIVAASKSLSMAIRDSRLEIGYVTLEYILSKIGLSYYGFQIVITAFIYGSIYYFIKKYSDDYALSCYVFFTMRMFSGPMNTVRMWIAISILMYSIDFIREKKLTKFTLLLVLAMLFQYSSIVFAIAYVMPGIKKRKNVYPIVILISIVILQLGTSFFSWITNIIGRYQGYLDSVYFNIEGNIAVYFNLAISLTFFLYFVNTYRFSGKIEIDSSDCKAHEYNYIWINFYLLIVAINIIGLRNSIMSRLSSYFNISSLAIIPYSIVSLKNSGNKEVIKVTIIMALFLQFLIILIFRPQWNYIINYSFFWSK